MLTLIKSLLTCYKAIKYSNKISFLGGWKYFISKVTSSFLTQEGEGLLAIGHHDQWTKYPGISLRGDIVDIPIASDGHTDIWTHVSWPQACSSLSLQYHDTAVRNLQQRSVISFSLQQSSLLAKTLRSWPALSIRSALRLLQDACMERWV